MNTILFKSKTIALGIFISLLILTYLGVAVSPSANAAPSGLWSPQWLSTYQRMRTENHVWWQLINSNCAKTGTSAERYADTGLWCTIVYKVTGDTVAGRRAVLRASTASPREASGNTRREESIESCIVYDALRPLLTPAEDAAWLDKLNRWAEIANAINTAPNVGGTRTYDEDQTVGVTLGMQCLDRVTGSSWATRDPALIPAVQADLDVAANGGELKESNKYNSGTSQLMSMGLLALPPGTYRNADQWFAAHAKYLPFSVTYDNRQRIQWGDEENPRDYTGQQFRYTNDQMMHQGIVGSPELTKLIDENVARYGAVGYGRIEPTARAFLTFDPYVTPASSPVRGSHLVTARGHFYFKGNNVSAMLSARNPAYEDHDWPHACGTHVYRNGEWVITSPISYGQWPYYKGEGVNCISLAGLGSMWQRGMTWNASGPDWIAVAHASAGGMYAPGLWNPPPAAVQYSGRSSVFIEDVDGWSVVVTRDTVNMTDPRTLPNFAGYRTSPGNHQAFITAAEGLPWTVWHSPVQPTRTGDQLAWTTAGGQSVKIDLLANTSIRDVMVNESAFGGNLAPTENKWHTKLNTASPVLWSVVRIGQGTPPAITRSGDTINIGTRTITMTTGGVTVDGSPGTSIPITPPPVVPPIVPPVVPPVTPPVTPPLPLSTRFITGDRVSTTANLQVRATAATTGTILGTQATGVQGTIVSGGTNATGFYWWNINYDSGVDGWSAQDYLVIAPPTPPPIVPPIVPPVVPPVIPPVTPPTTEVSTKFVPGDRVTTNDGLKVRATASATGTLLGTQPHGAKGTVVSGGTSAGGFYWWNINYDSGVDGWSAEAHITKIVAATPPPTETPNETPGDNEEPATEEPTDEESDSEESEAPVVTPSAGATVITSGTDYVQFTIGSSNGYDAIGLSNTDSSTSNSAVDFGFYLSKWNSFYCRTYGASLTGCGGSFKTGDVFRVSRSGETITFIKNGVNLLSWTRPSYKGPFKLPLKLDTAPAVGSTAAAADSLPISKTTMIVLGALIAILLTSLYIKRMKRK